MTKFNFETHQYKIPPKEWQTSFAKAVADFTYAYDGPKSLAIIYYGGHGYVKQENGMEEIIGLVRDVHYPQSLTMTTTSVS